jgi:hypothetical protein
MVLLKSRTGSDGAGAGLTSYSLPVEGGDGGHICKPECLVIALSPSLYPVLIIPVYLFVPCVVDKRSEVLFLCFAWNVPTDSPLAGGI